MSKPRSSIERLLDRQDRLLAKPPALAYLSNIARFMERQDRLSATPLRLAHQHTELPGLRLAERLFAQAGPSSAGLAALTGPSSAGRFLTAQTGLQTAFERLERASGIWGRLTGTSSLGISTLGLKFPDHARSTSVFDWMLKMQVPSLTPRGIAAPYRSPWERLIHQQGGGRLPRSPLAIEAEVLQARVAATERLTAYLPAPAESAAMPAEDNFGAVLQAVRDLAAQVEDLQRDSQKPALLKADFLLGQLIQLMILLFTLATQAAGDRVQDYRWTQLEDTQARILTLGQEHHRALVQERQALYMVKGRPVNLRQSPKPRSPVVVALYPNNRVRRVAAYGHWVRVEVLDLSSGEYHYGWCLKKYLKRARVPGG